MSGFTERTIAVVGATGTGKSALALELVQHLRERGLAAEVVNADAMQLYRGMNIGTAKLSETDRRGVPHHLLDVLEPSAESAVAEYQVMARSAISDVHERSAVAILVGGSGLYVSSTLFDFDFPATDPSVREELEGLFEQHGLARLVEELLRDDPEAAQHVDLLNPRRVIRALEVLRVTGAPIERSLPEEPRFWQPTQILGLTTPRAQLTQTLDARVEQMWREGIVAEASDLLNTYGSLSSTASRAIGYAQAFGQLAGELSEAEAIAHTQALTRRYARRQVSWFKRLPGVRWFETSASTDFSHLAQRALDLADAGDVVEF